MSERTRYLPRHIVEPIVRAALREDLGDAGDITTMATVPAGATLRARMASRTEGVAAGLLPAMLAFELVDTNTVVEAAVSDGDRVGPDQALLEVEGTAAAVLAAERVAANFLQRLSGIATATCRIVDAISHTRAKLLSTRKTTPTLRALEAHAVRAGGGGNHRLGLYDGILIKDNHLAAIGGDIETALRRVRESMDRRRWVQIEVDSLEQLERVLACGLADSVLLDNMPPEVLRKAVEMSDGQLVTEASGRVDIESAVAMAEAGVDYISSGWITHSAPALDIGLDVNGAG